MELNLGITLQKDIQHEYEQNMEHYPSKKKEVEAYIQKLPSFHQF